MNPRTKIILRDAGLLVIGILFAWAMVECLDFLSQLLASGGGALAFGPFSSTSKNKSEDSRVVSTDGSIAQGRSSTLVSSTTNAQQTTTNRLGLNAKQGRNILGDEAIQANSTYRVARGGRLTINNSDPAALQAVLDATAAQAASLRDALANAGDSSSDALGSVLSQLGDLASNRLTGGETERDKTILWIVLGLLALGAVYLWSKKS